MKSGKDACFKKKSFGKVFLGQAFFYIYKHWKENDNLQRHFET